MVEQMKQRNPTAKRGGLAPGFRRFIGVAEWLGAAGLVLPGLTSILPWLTPLAAAGLMIVTVGAVVYHLSRREPHGAIFASIWFVLAALVAYMRWLVLPL
jgi:VIT1/CCC1 family predicted Fe2+/Mn2+ transporter